MSVYYNDNDAYVCRWLRNLIDAGHLPPGDVDERPIEEVEPSDLDGYTQCHFFAGIGGWPLALRMAGWPDDRPVWTGSCPCQPFSSAGKRKGEDDERHLWPAFFALIAERRPPAVFGEQVASLAGREWLFRVRADMERVGYAVGAADLPAACIGAPHIRQRLWWVAHAVSAGRTQGRTQTGGGQAPRRSGDGGLAVAEGRGLGGRHGAAGQDGEETEDGGGLGDADEQGSQGHGQHGERAGERAARPPGPTGGIVWCDEREFGRGWVARRVEPGTFPLAHGIPARVGRLRAYGNAIVPHVAAAFVRACMESDGVTARVMGGGGA